MTELELPTFRSAVWNLYGGTPVEQSRPALKETIDWGCTLWIVCEARGKSRDRLFESEGLETAAHDQIRIAWDPKRWKLEREWGRRLSETHYFKKDGKTKVWSLGQMALLRDLKTGLLLHAASYHTPSGVQTAKDQPKRRYQAFIETLLYLAADAKETEADGYLSGGDDNWDEDGKNEKGGGVQTKDTDPIMLGRATGLVQVQANKPTFAAREIDDYRILSFAEGGHIRPTNDVEVIDGRGAERPSHKIHMREWAWHNIDGVSPEPEPRKSIKRIAKEVIAGKWGNGEERRSRLTSAGYSYDAVQAKVVELLASPPEPIETEHQCPACGKLHMGVIPGHPQ